MSTRPRTEKPGRFSKIIFESPEHQRRFLEMLSLAGKHHNDGTKIGGDQLIRQRK